MPSTTSAMPTAAFVLALISLVVAVAALTWNVVQFLLTGSRPRVLLLVGAITGNGTGLVTWPPSKGGASNIRHLAEQGMKPTPALAVKVVNHGRAPLRVERWSVKEEPSGIKYTPLAGGFVGPELPHDLPAGANAIFALDMEVVQRGAYASAATFGTKNASVVVQVELGTGKMLTAKGRLPVGLPAATS
ncbi:hypothetical protein [Pseudonocardia acidicola]|uniref:DUF58 domain-containing protein n=1 Tax=Pseudonocardia acidicola TaxID=2724939 RepID=A0ABX1SH22_9PSEU|nr:hypothetical protein [Pseudonocardia acidicola]NMI00866.1 hypothetical protein [Pseudonocardia acidicola]